MAMAAADMLEGEVWAFFSSKFRALFLSWAFRGLPQMHVLHPSLVISSSGGAISGSS